MSNDPPGVHSIFDLRPSTVLVVLYALLALIIVPIFPHFTSTSEFSRWAVAASIVDGRTVEVTWLAPLLGPSDDLSEVDGRLYSNKAPGGALIGLPAYALARALAGPPAAATMRPTLDAMRILAATVPALLLAMLVAMAGRRLGASEERVTLAIAALLFGTPLFAYGLLNFSHALAAFALFAAWYLLFVAPGAWRDVAAGALIGLAVFSEYPCAVAGAVLVAFAIRWRSVPRVVAGGAPLALALAVYNRLAFGSVFTLSSAHERLEDFRIMASKGLFGIGLPQVGTLLHLLLDPSKGLLVFSPILLLAAARLPRARRGMTGRQFWSLVVAPLALIILYAGYPNWHGGWTVGARYLVPTLPFLLFPLVFAAGSWLESLALGASIATCSISTLVFPFVPPYFPLPWRTLALPLLAHGLVTPNLLHLVARPLAITVPFAIVIAAAVLATRRRVALASGALAVLVLSAPVEPSKAVRMERAFIEEVYFERSNAIVHEWGTESTVPPNYHDRAAARRARPPTSWPF